VRRHDDPQRLKNEGKNGLEAYSLSLMKFLTSSGRGNYSGPTPEGKRRLLRLAAPPATLKPKK
jgi:hypothetical protein